MANDSSFAADLTALRRAVELLEDAARLEADLPLPEALPLDGVGEADVLEHLAPHVLGKAAILNAPHVLAHMDPPTPWLTWALTLWNARLNQNLLHPSTAPFAREVEQRVIHWLAPVFGMEGGHMTPGSTIANLTALWASRDAGNARRVVCSDAAHVSIRKAAHILGMTYEPIATDSHQRLKLDALPSDLSDACLVLTAGTTSVGALDPLEGLPPAAWTHVDAAWAGPLALSDEHAWRLMGIEDADSIAISAHKWLFQPKESALVLFRDAVRAEAALSFGGSYLATPNVGVLGSHGAAAIPLLGLLLAWGRSGIATRIDRCMALAQGLADALEKDPRFVLFGPPQAGVVAFQPLGEDIDSFSNRLPPNLVSMTAIAGDKWLRCVAANPTADLSLILRHLDLEQAPR